ncbi:unnamed protein product [Symbiodinium microadriaticum]|nr:unnamed protein product [Symbiodinium microadriaticum]
MLEQVLKRPGTVDFEQLFSAGCVAKSQNQSQPATPNPSVISAPSTPVPLTQQVPPEQKPNGEPAPATTQQVPPEPKPNSEPAPPATQQVPPEPKPNSEPAPPPHTKEPDDAEDMADQRCLFYALSDDMFLLNLLSGGVRLQDRKMKKNAYMRFSRSMTSPNTPKAVLEAYDRCKDSNGESAANMERPKYCKVIRSKVNDLFKQFMDCSEEWGESDLVLQSEDLLLKYNGDEEIVKNIIASKEATTDQWMDNPDAPGNKEYRAYLCWDIATETADDENISSITQTRAASIDQASQARSSNEDAGLIMALVQSMNSQGEALRKLEKYRFPRHSQATMTGGLLSWEGGTYPRLDLKGWNTRLFTAFFYVVLNRLQQDTDRTDGMPPLLLKELRLAFGAVNAIAAFLDTMERSPRYLSEAQALSMSKACSTFLSLCEILALLSIQRQVPRWKAVPKHHAFKHLAEDQVLTKLNCRFFHSFVDEDFIGFWKGLVQAAPKELLEFRCLTRYLLRLKVL